MMGSGSQSLAFILSFDVSLWSLQTIAVKARSNTSNAPLRRLALFLITSILIFTTFEPQRQLSGWSWETGINLDENVAIKKTWGDSLPLTYAFEFLKVRPQWARLFRANRELDNNLIREEQVDFNALRCFRNDGFYASVFMSIRS